ncbi:MAG: PQQ-dependent sugar dehydrogenase [Desulfuromonadales bacterium]|nr:PQQ-dependent sugar dehydrogenase [Desulfuromonadales bacterium]
MKHYSEGLKTFIASALFAAISALSLAACGGGGGAPAATPAPLPASISLTRVAGGFSQPVAITNAGDGSNRLFVVEQGGTVKIMRNGVVAPAAFLNITSLVTPTGGEQGLLGLAFPPGFAARGTFYVNYTNRTAVGNTVVARFGLGASADIANPNSRQELLTIVQPFTNHNGGQLAFGPDSLLYIGTGDGGSGGDPLGNGQSLTTLLGKLLRIDVLGTAAPYAIPAGNPFANEILAYGLRNPWRFSFDRLTGDLYLADVGQNLVEEVNFQPAGSGVGANYGWNVMEGSSCFANPSCSSAGLTLPVAEYRHGSGDCSVTGGYVYRGSNPSLRGVYLYGDFCSGRIWGLRRSGSTWENRLLNDTPFLISTFGEDEAGELYLADYGSGDIYRITAP